MERQKVAYYFYRDICYEEKPRGFRVVQYVKDNKTGDYYAILKRKGVPLCIWLIFLCSLGLLIFADRMEDEGSFQIIMPSEVSSFVSDRIYLGMCVQGEPEVVLQLKLYGEDDRCLLKGYTFMVGQTVGNVMLQGELRLGAEAFRLELWQEGTGKLVFERTVTVVYKREEIP